jgi:hypothetical protein
MEMDDMLCDDRESFAFFHFFQMVSASAVTARVISIFII